MSGTEFFPANLRIVEFYQHKASNYRQNPFKNFSALHASLYIYHSQLEGTVNFPRQNKDWDGIFPGRISPGQSFSLPRMRWEQVQNMCRICANVQKNKRKNMRNPKNGVGSGTPYLIIPARLLQNMMIFLIRKEC